MTLCITTHLKSKQRIVNLRAIQFYNMKIIFPTSINIIIDIRVSIDTCVH